MLLKSKVSSQLDDQGTVECLEVQFFPEEEESGHDLVNPGKCRCYPEFEFYYDEDGSIGLSTVNHKWVQ